MEENNDLLQGQVSGFETGQDVELSQVYNNISDKALFDEEMFNERPNEGSENSYMESPFERYDRAIVKVFIINYDGNWSDCGAGRISFEIESETQVILTVLAEGENLDEEKDPIEEVRMKKLRGIHLEDSNMILKVNMNKGSSFTRSQSNFWLN